MSERWVEELKVSVIHVFKDQTRHFRIWIATDIQQFDDVCSSIQALQDLDLPLDFLLFHRLQNLNNAPLVVDNIDALKNVTVLPSSHFSNNLVVVLFPPSNGEIIIVPVIRRPAHVHVRIYSRNGDPPTALEPGPPCHAFWPGRPGRGKLLSSGCRDCPCPCHRILFFLRRGIELPQRSPHASLLPGDHRPKRPRPSKCRRLGPMDLCRT
mmetsp:Transcript_13691/g.28084  ORF Transcript_13691/g.28084 Transcript_13691/m.28084 type:complete len:210 (-) Transcript_13691:269-898(-)